MIDMVPSTRLPAADKTPPPALSQSIINAEHVERAFSEGVGVFDLTFMIPAGAIFGLVGPSGCGKTTTVRLLTRDAQILLQAHPQINDVRRSRSQPGLLYLTVADAATMLPLILALVSEQPTLAVQQAEMYEPPFDDIFIQLMEQADDAPESEVTTRMLLSQGQQ